MNLAGKLAVQDRFRGCQQLPRSLYLLDPRFVRRRTERVVGPRLNLVRGLLRHVIPIGVQRIDCGIGKDYCRARPVQLGQVVIAGFWHDVT